MNEDTIVTLIGIKMAKPGLEFIFKGKIPDCNGCRFKNSCFNLNKGARYKIVSVRNTSPMDCSIHEGGVQAVDVIEAPWTIMVESRMAISGSNIVYKPIHCNETECEMIKFCDNPGPVPKKKYTISNISDKPIGKCAKNYSLKLVEIKE
ncbi:MAG: hypothetical protein C5S41_07775 [Candidatus Methanomarinus sp.]|nr:MAG: hypothetical protein C5S41_07775 [ANME-2 cluster archaeon]KAF5424666.1 hypothetical protein C5S42_12770 [ANME-2 cluster archaeon]